MGFLSKGTPLGWNASLQFHAYIKQHGIQQFLNIYREMKDRNKDVFLWGDEVEHLIVEIQSKQRIRLSLRAAPILQALEKQGKET